jgi:hypothetical protein
MTDLLYLLVTLVAFAGLALLVGAIDRSEQRSSQQSDR